MRKLQESIEIIQRLIEKNKEQLNALDQELAKKHLLKLYEYFQTEWNKKEDKQEKIISNVNLFSWDEEEIETEEVEKESIVENEKVTLNENKEKNSEEGAEIQEENIELNQELEHSNSLETESVAKEIEIKEEKSENTTEEVNPSISLASNHFSFEPPVDQSEVKENFFKEWAPKSEIEENIDGEKNREQDNINVDQPLIKTDLQETEKALEPLFNDETKSTFLDVEKDLHLKKQRVYLKDIRNQIGINDRYLFSNELFKNKESYEKALDIINEAQNEDEIWGAINDLLLHNKEGFNEEDEVFMSFKETIHQFLKLS